MKKLTAIEQKVLAINLLNDHMKIMAQEEIEFFTPAIGKDIFKQYFVLKAKYDHSREEIKGTTPEGVYFNTHCWLTKEYDGFYLNAKICINGGSYDVQPSTAFCLYENGSVKLFDVVKVQRENKIDYVLENPTTDFSKLDVRYDVAELEAQALKVKEAADQYRAALESVPYIFRDTLYLKSL